MQLRNGRRLGPYEILAPVGAGGMGEVYRARDTRLDRIVAIKVVAGDIASNERLKIRFEREAKTISALSHPHICTLYDVGHDNGSDYFVMEYCDGRTLASVIADGPLLLAEALRYAIEIAAALDAAHRAGIVHRDLKPSNIAITKSGVKVLDFGLAKQDSIGSPRDITEEGKILGTVRYCAPEVLQGKAADSRCDIFALGLILYEMIAGKRAFDGPTEPTIIAAILESEPPPLRDTVPSVPYGLDQLISSCLTKDREARIQTAHDVRLQLEWIEKGHGDTAVTQPTRRTSWLVFGALTVVSVVFGFSWFAQWRERNLSPAETPASHRVTVTRSIVDLRGAPLLALGAFATPVGFVSPLIAVSHDGTLLVYVGFADGKTQLFKRRLDSLVVERIPGTEGARYAFFSPDDRWLGFLTNDKVMKIPVGGGSGVTVTVARNPVRAVWHPTGHIFVIDASGTSVFRVSADGGTIETVPSPYRTLLFHDVLPDGKAALARLATGSGDFSKVVLFDFHSRTIVPLLNHACEARFVAPGFLVFAHHSDLYVVRFDLEKRQIHGEPTLLQAGVAMESIWGVAQYVISDDGMLVYVPGGDRSLGRLAWVDRHGKSILLEMPARVYGVFNISQDGQKLATEEVDASPVIRVFDFQRHEERRVPLQGGEGRFPRWTSRGTMLVGVAPHGQTDYQVAEVDLIGHEVEVLLAEKNVGFRFTTASDDARTLCVARYERGNNKPDFRVMSLGGKRFVRSVDGGIGEISPDGRWIAFTSNRTGRGEIWVEPTDRASEAYQISTDGGLEASWCRQCGKLFYRKGTQWYEVKIHTDARVTWTPPRRAWKTEFVETDGRSYDVSPDGEQLLVSMRTRADITDRIHLVQNWPALLEGSRPANR